MPFAQDGIEDVAAVELADGKQIKGGGKQSHPGCAADGLQRNTGGVQAGTQEFGEKCNRQRVTQRNGFREDFSESPLTMQRGHDQGRESPR